MSEVQSQKRLLIWEIRLGFALLGGSFIEFLSFSLISLSFLIEVFDISYQTINYSHLFGNIHLSDRLDAALFCAWLSQLLTP